MSFTSSFTRTPDEEITRRKQALRAEMRLRLEALSPEEAADSGKRIARDILASAWYREARSVFLYVSVGKEPDTRPILEKALRDGKTVCVPKCGKRPLMDAVRIFSPAELRPGAFGIPEPEASGPVLNTVDLVLVPCLSVCPDGTRLGHGGGYYDAYLRACSAKTVCLCHESLLSAHIPADSGDVPVNAYTAGKGLILCSRRD